MSIVMSDRIKRSMETSMPLLLCPNDNASMQTVQRAGVEFDMCPTCRGVWLDRGELEKLIGAATEAAPRQAAPPPPSYDQRPPEPRYQGGYERDQRWQDDKYRHKKRKGFDIFDIFD